jgi:hypothetical protein
MEYAKETLNNTMAAAVSAVSWVAREKQSVSLGNLSNNNILNFANDINCLLGDIDKDNQNLQLPLLVAIGSQSSGKSSVIDSFLGMDKNLLPTGKEITTRTPTIIKLHNVKKHEIYIDFGEYADDGWITHKKIQLTYPNPTHSEIAEVRQFIIKRTKEVAGDNLNISKNPIIMNLYSPFVPDLVLHDTPGLITVPQLDKGQSADICEQIRDLALDYIRNPNAIVMVIIPATSDFATDNTLSLIRNCKDAKCRTVGIITKPDLMNEKNHVGDNLLNKISKNFHLDYGYYVVKNKTSDMVLNGITASEMERQYFSNHYEYKKPIYKNRLAFECVIKDMSQILVAEIEKKLPQVLQEIQNLDNEMDHKLSRLGQGPPTTKDGQLSEINIYINDLGQQISECIESRGLSPNIGKSIGELFGHFRKEIMALTPIKSNKEVYTNDFFHDIVLSFRGYHMASNISVVNILEKCIADTKNDPFISLQEMALKYLAKTKEVLIKSVTEISQDEKYNRYPELRDAIIKTIIDDFITPQAKLTEEYILGFTASEKAYIWSDDQDFLKELSKFPGKTEKAEDDMSDVKDLLESYLMTVKKNLKNNVPKIIMANLVRNLQNQRKLSDHLYNNSIKDDMHNLLKEDPDIEKQRKYYDSIKSRIASLKIKKQ